MYSGMYTTDSSKYFNKKEIIENLYPKDGKKHYYAVKGGGLSKRCDHRIETVVRIIEEQGYEVLDVSLSIGGDGNFAFLVVYQ